MSTGEPIDYKIYDIIRMDEKAKHKAIVELVREEQVAAQAYELKLLTMTEAYKSKSFRKLSLIIEQRINTLTN